MHYCLILSWSRRNNNSLAALAGASEAYSNRLNLDVVISKGVLKEEVSSRANRYDKIFVGFSFMTVDHSTILGELESLKTFPRWIDEKLVLIAGGSHPSGDPEGCLEAGFDYVVLGEGEETLPRLISAVVMGGRVEEVNGVALAKGGRAVVNPARGMVDLDSHPPFPLRGSILAPLEISRGCPFPCLYCQTPRIHGFTMRHRTVKTICRYLRHAASKGKKRTWFTSSNALAYGSRTGRRPDLSKVEALLKAVKRVPGIEEVFFGTFPSEVRPEFLTGDAAALLRDHCANTRVCIGGQSGSRRLLRLVGRGHGVDAIYNAVDACRDHGLIPIVDVILGLPTEDEEDREDTRALIKWTVGVGGRIHVHAFTPLPGTPFQSEPPGSIHPSDKRLLESLVSEGKAFGQWMTPEST